MALKLAKGLVSLMVRAKVSELSVHQTGLSMGPTLGQHSKELDQV